MTVVTEIDRSAMDAQPFFSWFDAIIRSHGERLTVDEDQHEITVDVGDNNQAGQYEKLAPNVVFKRRVADKITFDLGALSKIYNVKFIPPRRRGFWERLFAGRKDLGRV
jgi:hypothetical protein